MSEINGWGDVAAAATQAMGIPSCGGCKKRQAWLNQLPFPGKAPTVSTSSVRVGAEASIPVDGSIVSGAIPPGLTFDGSALSGVPLAAGSFRLTVQKNSRSQTLLIRIAEAT